MKRNAGPRRIYRVGGFGIQSHWDVDYFDLKQLEFEQGWRKKWFYVTDTHEPGQLYGVPKFELGIIVEKKHSWHHKPSTREADEAKPLLSRVDALLQTVVKEVNGIHLIATFVKRRVHPLQARVHPLYEYEGTTDPSRPTAEEMSKNEVETYVCSLAMLKVGEQCDFDPQLPHSALISRCMRLVRDHLSAC